MTEPTNPTDDREERLARLIAEYLEAVESGQSPDRDALLAAHPDLAADLARFFAGHDRLQRLASPLREAAQAAQDLPPDPTADRTETLTGAPAEPHRPDPEPTQPLDDAPATGDTVRYFGDYQLNAEIARGGMGIVYRARQVSLNRPVALKMLLHGVLASEEERRRFRVEAEAAATLDHPHIVPIHEVGEHDGHAYFSMKLVEGGSLATHRTRYVEDPKAAARLVATVARAVHHAHQRGVLHRDLKPSNVLLDAAGAPHVVDFGLARRVESDDDLTRTGAVLGTPAYMAPEQAASRRGEITTATDIYGLGAILYVLLTGQAPFRGDSAMDTLEQVKTRAPEPPSAHNRRVDPDLQTICMKCLEKEPRRRYASAEALADDLDRWLRGEPIHARPVGRLERAWLWARRRPAIAALSLAVLLSLLAGLIGTSLALRLALRREREAKAQATLANQRLDQTMQSVEDYYTGVAEEVILGRPEFRALRERLLAKPLKFYNELTRSLASRPHPDAREQALLARGRHNVGKILHTLGRHEEARAQFQAAMATFQSLAARHPDIPEHRSNLASSYTGLSAVLRDTGRVAEAESAVRAAIALREPLVAARPDIPDYQHQLATSYANLGAMFLDTGRVAEAESAVRAAIARYGPLVAARPDVPDYQRQLASSSYNLGLVLDQVGRPREAESALRESIAHYGTLMAAWPGVPDYPAGMAGSYTSLSFVLREAGRPRDAESAVRAAIALREPLVAARPDIPDFRDGLALSYNNLGEVLRDTGRPGEAESAFHEAIARYGPLVAARPDVPRYRAALAGSYNNLGGLLLGTGRPSEAEVVQRKALEVCEALVAEQPTVPEYALRLGASYCNLGAAFAALGRQENALELYDRAVATLGPVLRGNTRHARARRFLHNSHWNRAGLLVQLGRTAEADADWEQALALAPEAEREQLAVDRADALILAAIRGARGGDPEAALGRIAALLDRAASLPAQNRYNLACALAVCAATPRPDGGDPAEHSHRTDPWAARAVALLDQARATGFFAEARNRELLETDADLDALRDRDDFRLLRLDAAMPPAPFAR
jgi:tetratricopeptide (TPR) repeat protein/tRNA A-37 threonylcarbamoyl transferase component Bud32